MNNYDRIRGDKVQHAIFHDNTDGEGLKDL